MFERKRYAVSISCFKLMGQSLWSSALQNVVEDSGSLPARVFPFVKQRVVAITEIDVCLISDLICTAERMEASRHD